MTGKAVKGGGLKAPAAFAKNGAGPAAARRLRHFALAVAPHLPGPDPAACEGCAVSCQSACKTSCTVGNQPCERLEARGGAPERLGRLGR
ncbi:MAG: six-cysteine ranthipeptide SCIFF [Acetobacteraceae bacterium]|nr:six-cysteine ranthipeptide SCIFF [Acetobacteraceae bacterium]